MKKNIIILLLLFIGISCLSCSVEKQLDESLKLGFIVKPMNTVDPEPIIALNDGTFDILASNPSGAIVSFTVKHSSDFPGTVAGTQVLVANNVTVDAQGKFSEPCPTVLIKYPIQAIGKSGDILEAQFSFTDTKGNVVSTKSRKTIVNFKSWNTLRYFYQTMPFYSFYTGLSYRATSTKPALKDTMDVFWFRDNNIMYMSSPNSPRTAQEMALRYKTVVFNIEEMNSTKIIKLEGITLVEIDDKAFAKMDFSNAVTIIEAEKMLFMGYSLKMVEKQPLNFVITQLLLAM